jgi:hypothetical protein
MKDFDNFIKENVQPSYRLFIQSDDSILEDVQWDMVLNFSDLWNKYENKDIDLKTFVEKYKLRVNENKSNIIDNKGIKTWNDLVKILNDFKSYDIETSNGKFNEIYDWADENNIEIKTK